MGSPPEIPKSKNNYSHALFTKDWVGLASKFEVSPNSCKNPEHFKEYLLYRAIPDGLSGRATTHILLDSNKENIIGFFSLKATTLITDQANSRITGEPALEIYNLAVSKDHILQGIGTTLVFGAIHIAQYINKNHIGIKYIVLTSVPEAVDFYKKCKFVKMEDYYTLPTDNENNSCIPMIMKLYS